MTKHSENTETSNSTKPVLATGLCYVVECSAGSYDDYHTWIAGIFPDAIDAENLKKEIEKGRFREDLYHRLAVILIKVPGLNERRDDIPLLIEHFTEKIAAEQGIAPKSFSDDAIKLLQEYDWTGNIRELRNIVERLIILSGNEISVSDIHLFASK